jgi:hypothetical protein
MGRAKRVACVCLTVFASACARGGDDAGSDWSLPGDMQPDPEAIEPDAAAPIAVPVVDASIVPTSVPSPSSTVPSPPPVTVHGAADDGTTDDGAAEAGAPLDTSGSDSSTAVPFPEDSEVGATVESAEGSASPPVTSQPSSVAALGDLLITEVMFAPFGPRPDAEWFEVYNTGASPSPLGGMTIVDGSMNEQTIASDVPIVVAPGAYVLLVRDRATALANGLPAAAIVYEYGAGLSRNEGVQLDDGPTGAVSLWDGNVELASAPYGSWGLIALGQSVELATLQLVGSDLSESWCYAEVPWAPGADFGTPGAMNDCDVSGSP